MVIYMENIRLSNHHFVYRIKFIINFAANVHNLTSRIIPYYYYKYIRLGVSMAR